MASIVKILRVVAEPNRLRLLLLLKREELSVAELQEILTMGQSTISTHLAQLKQAGLVRDRHEGRQTHYSPQLGALGPLIDWTRQMAGFWESRFDDLEDLLKRMDQ